MAYSHLIAGALAQATEQDKIEFAHFLADALDTAEDARDSARVRAYVAAFDRFAAPGQGDDI